MTQSSTLYVGMEVHKDAIAVAYVTQEPPAEVVSLAAIPATHLVAFLFILLQHSLSGSCLHEGQIGSELCLRWGRYDVKK